jgi:hypothetical protein
MGAKLPNLCNFQHLGTSKLAHLAELGQGRSDEKGVKWEDLGGF